MIAVVAGAAADDFASVWRNTAGQGAVYPGNLACARACCPLASDRVGRCSYFAMLGYCFHGAIFKWHQLIISKKIGRLHLEDLEYLNSQSANFILRMAITTHLDEMPKRPGIGGHKYLGFGGVRKNTSGRLPGKLSSQGFVRLVLELFSKKLHQLHITGVCRLNRFQPNLVGLGVVGDTWWFDIFRDRFIDITLA